MVNQLQPASRTGTLGHFFRQVWEETKEKVAVALLTKQSEGAANWKWTFYLLYGFETGVEKLGVVQLQENTCDP